MPIFSYTGWVEGGEVVLLQPTHLSYYSSVSLYLNGAGGC